MDTIKMLIVKILDYVLRIFWVFPVKRNLVIFISFGGKQYSDSPMYIYKELCKYKNLELFWVFENPSECYADYSLQYFRKNTIKYFFNILRARVIVTNDFLDAFIPIRKSQCLINTWHGGGWFKCVGKSDKGANKYEQNTYVYRAKKTTEFIASSEFWISAVLKNSFAYDGNVLRIGMPRNSILFECHPEIRNKVFSYIKRPVDDSLIILYAPTYRGDAAHSNWLKEENRLDIKRCIKSFEDRFHKPILFMFRAHHALRVLDDLHQDYYDVSNYPDMQELISISDFLITDYSSCMWDFFIIDKPVFVFASDYMYYAEDRGFLLDIKEWPFEISYSNDEIEEKIKTFDYTKYQDRTSIMKKKVVIYDNRGSNKLATSHIIGIIHGGEE